MACAADEFDPSTELGGIQLEEVLSVGLVEGVEAEAFGRIADVKASGDGGFMVLDGQAPSVRWFDSLGAYRDGIDSRGAGPGELSSPRAMAVSSDQRLAVLDPGNGRVSLYRLMEDGLTFQGQMRNEVSSLGSSQSICDLQGRWYMRSLLEGSVIHELDDDGKVVASFGDAESAPVEEYGPFAELVAPQKNAGALACLETPGLLVTVDTFTPSVRAFTPDGDLRWEVEVSGLRPMEFVVREGVLETERDPDQGSHIGVSILSWGPESVLVQYVIVPEDVRPGEEELQTIESVELTVQDGGEVARSREIPHLTDRVGRLVYTYRNLPYPVASVLRISE